MRSARDLTLAAMLAALYVAIGLAFPMISFGFIQCRISDALYPLIAVLGLPALVGLSIGHFTYNFIGYQLGISLGLLDVIISPILFIIPKLLIYRFGFKAVPVHVVFVGLWVPVLLNLHLGFAYLPAVISVGIGEAIAEMGLGIPLAKALEKRIKIDQPNIIKGNIKDGILSKRS